MTTSECAICHQDREWHQKHKPHHAFVTEGGGLEEAEYEEPVVPKRQTPFDPVLRFLMIQKGLISAEELMEAEAKLKATGMLVTDSPTAATPANAWK